jgi:prepilin signal peptidase PulO-like enzyme (type II secretory pathway)
MIQRTVNGEDFVRGRSRCDNCRKEIAWYDNIPLVSYILLRGKCRYCKQKIAFQHFAIELVTGVLFVWWYAVGFAFFRLSQEPLQIVQPAFWLMVGIFLLIIFATDWVYQIIPDYATIGLVVLAFFYRVYITMNGAMHPKDFWWTLASGVLLMLLMFGIWWVTKGRGMGFGDVKFALPMGWLLGWNRALVALFLAFVIGAVVGLLLIGLNVKHMKSKIAFGPFLVLATGISLIWGHDIWGWYMGLM